MRLKNQEDGGVSLPRTHSSSVSPAKLGRIRIGGDGYAAHQPNNSSGCFYFIFIFLDEFRSFFFFFPLFMISGERAGLIVISIKESLARPGPAHQKPSTRATRRHFPRVCSENTLALVSFV